MTIKKGDKIKVDYEGRLEDGTIFDSSKHGEHSHPIEFVVGNGEVISGFDAAVIGMKNGEEKELKLEPEKAYGKIRGELKKKIPREVLPADQEPKVGMMLLLKSHDGRQMPIRITEVDSKTVTIVSIGNNMKGGKNGKKIQQK